MPRKASKPIVLNDLLLTKLVAEGKTIARHEGKILFVEGGIPGDVVDVQIYKKKSDYSLAKVIALKQASPDRVPAFCKHFGTCGGCKWQQLKYEKQVAYKQQIVEDAFKHIGKLDYPTFEPIFSAEPTQYYRNKMEFTFSNRRWYENPLPKNDDPNAGSPHTTDTDRRALGFHVAAMFDRVVHIDHCYLQAEPSNTLRNAFFKFAQAENYTFYDVKNHTGLLRNFLVRNTSIGQTMLIVCFSGEATETIINSCMTFLDQNYGHLIHSLQYVINPKRNDSLFDLPIITYKGNSYITETLEDLQYKISPKSFFQTNPYQTLRMYKTIRDMAALSGQETVYDLYTGTGSIALFVAKQCRQVIGIEEVADAIADAQINAQINKIKNAHFYAGDVRLLLNNELTQKHGKPDVLISDPPRAGMHPDVLRQIILFSPQKIIYVSCNPATQARDLQLLQTHYEIEKVQPIDMFPHTYHVENIVLLNKIIAAT